VSPEAARQRLQRWTKGSRSGAVRTGDIGRGQAGLGVVGKGLAGRAPPLLGSACRPATGTQAGWRLTRIGDAVARRERIASVPLCAAVMPSLWREILLETLLGKSRLPSPRGRRCQTPPLPSLLRNAAPHQVG
jgi:hypothetical protein